MADTKSDGNSGGEKAETTEQSLNGAAEASDSAVRLEAFDATSDAAEEEILDPREQEIERLQNELDQVRDQLMRAAADVQNTRRRAERDRKEAETFGGSRLARDILGVYDNLDKALSLISDELREKDAGLVAGLELTQREMLQTFAKHKIERVSPEKGDKFDPNLHEAMFEAPFGEPGTVVEIMQDGFKLADRLLRPASVGVASANAQPTPAPESDAAEGDGGGDKKDD